VGLRHAASHRFCVSVPLKDAYTNGKRHSINIDANFLSRFFYIASMAAWITRSLSFAHEDIVGNPTGNLVGSEDGNSFRQAEFTMMLRDFRNVSVDEEIAHVTDIIRSFLQLNSDLLSGKLLTRKRCNAARLKSHLRSLSVILVIR